MQDSRIIRGIRQFNNISKIKGHIAILQNMQLFHILLLCWIV
jgi:hypothetical protein